MRNNPCRRDDNGVSTVSNGNNNSDSNAMNENYARGMPWEQFIPTSSAAGSSGASTLRMVMAATTATAAYSSEGVQMLEKGPTDVEERMQKASEGAEEKLAEDSAATEARLKQLYRELCPMLDRFGRVISDLSSQLWSEVEQQPPASQPYGKARAH